MSGTQPTSLLGVCSIEVFTDDAGFRRVRVAGRMAGAGAPEAWRLVFRDVLPDPHSNGSEVDDVAEVQDGAFISMMLMDAVAAVSPTIGVSMHEFIAAYYKSIDTADANVRVTERLIEALQETLEALKAERVQRQPKLSLVEGGKSRS